MRLRAGRPRSQGAASIAAARSCDILRAMTERKRRGRAERRLQARTEQRLTRELDRLARMQPGGAPDRPLVIDTPAVVELRAVARPCPLCGGSLRLKAHTAEVIEDVRLRVAAVACTACGSERSLYFRLEWPSLH